MMGIGSLFYLSLGLSVLVEVVKMLNGVGKKGKPTSQPLGRGSSAGFPSSLWRLHAAKRRRRCWGRGLSPAGQVSISGSSRSVWVRSLSGAPVRARPKGASKWS